MFYLFSLQTTKYDSSLDSSAAHYLSCRYTVQYFLKPGKLWTHFSHVYVSIKCCSSVNFSLSSSAALDSNYCAVWICFSFLSDCASSSILSSMGAVYMKNPLSNLTYLSSQLSLPVSLLGVACLNLKLYIHVHLR